VNSLPLYLDEADQVFRTARISELDAYYIQFRTNASVGKEKIEGFLSAVESVLQKKKPSQLIIDLRFDGGGDLNTTRGFFERVTRLMSGKQEIYVLTSGQTFSAGIASLGYLKQAGSTHVCIVGEPIGDGLEFWAEGPLIVLPVSKALLLSATERHNYLTGCPEADCHDSIRRHPIRVPTLDPDFRAPLSYADYRRGHDPALEAVRNAMGRNGMRSTR
jgi:hypothetical protein